MDGIYAFVVRGVGVCAGGDVGIDEGQRDPCMWKHGEPPTTIIQLISGPL